MQTSNNPTISVMPEMLVLKLKQSWGRKKVETFSARQLKKPRMLPN